MRIGQGFDVHAFASGRKLTLGGVHIPYEFGLAGHSDADVLAHALCDALLGAAGLGDIGQHFPDSDEQWRDADSMELLAQVVAKVQQAGWNIVNVDATIIAQAPRLKSFIPRMRERLGQVLGLSDSCVSVKATTTEHLGFAGRKEGMAAMAVALLGQRRRGDG
ncbi:MAG: 2-C-methyl-D-erythritol 2,4-cyclodiphosphate synthase [Zetaproteobacteria bacterium]|nr:MAG: 2-C-methyl-D-erythritol 2,4-cyclodiphosphate synthase [Zetaproteobacteria bacterium]